jgi:hypothetical protein
MRRYGKKQAGGPLAGLIFGILCLIAFFATQRQRPAAPAGGRSAAPAAARSAPATNPATIERIERMIRSAGDVERKDGIAAAVLIDTSGSMKETVRDANGRPQAKLDIARRCVSAIVRQTAGFAKDEPNTPTVIGIYEFSSRGQSVVRPVTPIVAPDAPAADRALASLQASGNTPIGQAMIQAKKDLDATKLARTHILIVTDGENTAGFEPGDVMWAVNRLPDEQRPGIYFIAFDVAASVFQPAKDAGALVLPAANEQELRERLDFVMGSKILLEQ